MVYKMRVLWRNKRSFQIYAVGLLLNLKHIADLSNARYKARKRFEIWQIIEYKKLAAEDFDEDYDVIGEIRDIGLRVLFGFVKV